VTKKLISFSLYGDDQDYQRGAVANLRVSKEIYPGWICRFYVSQEISENTVEALITGGGEVVRKQRKGLHDGMLWRFLPAGESDITLLLVRDTDALLSLRERHAVDAWIASGKRFHIMRDIPAHKELIMGGLWGCRGQVIPNMASLIEGWSSHSFGADQSFLRRKVYPKIKQDVVIHSDFVAFKGETVFPFPSPRVDGEWVGMPVHRDRVIRLRKEYVSKMRRSGLHVVRKQHGRIILDWLRKVIRRFPRIQRFTQAVRKLG
jgi:hypothetical protein